MATYRVHSDRVAATGRSELSWVSAGRPLPQSHCIPEERESVSPTHQGPGQREALQVLLQTRAGIPFEVDDSHRLIHPDLQGGAAITDQLITHHQRQALTLAPNTTQSPAVRAWECHSPLQSGMRAPHNPDEGGGGVASVR